MVAMPFRTALTAVVAAMGLSGKIEPLTFRSVIEDAFPSASARRALKEFKQTEAFQAIYRKYFP